MGEENVVVEEKVKPKVSTKVKLVLGLRTLMFGVIALAAVDGALFMLVKAKPEAVVIQALAPIFGGAFTTIGIIVVAVATRHIMESAATGGGIGGALKVLMTPVKPPGQDGQGGQP